MSFCTNCGSGNADSARFCAQCGNALTGTAPAAPEPAPEARKTVTVLFTDIAGSTKLGEQLDPEALRMLMGRYFAQARQIVERHGGTVEKFIGDAVMAVFGVPAVHEDDAIRAVRAAFEMGAALETLNDEFESRWGVRVAVRTGINTGPVVAGDPALGHGFVAGDAVNVAARLEQSAGQGEVLVGEATYRLTRDACEFAAQEPVALKGKSRRVKAWRLVDVRPDAPGVARRMDAPLVGRERELAALEAAFDEVVAERSARLFTVVGPAGIGKSRLAEELVGRVGERATVAVGRCLPYGTITYWPVRQVVGRLCDIPDGTPAGEIQDRIAARIRGDDADAVAARVAEAVELCEPTAAPSADDTFWAIRRLLADAAGDRPLVVVFDDIHWGEPTFLDLLQYVVGFTRDVPVLVLCLARRELFDSRPNWGAASDGHQSLVLDPLGEAEVDELLRRSDDAVLPRDVTERITHAAEGNPLFVAEMQRMLVDEGFLERRNGSWLLTREFEEVPLPPTIDAVLSARLDRLEVEERGLLQRAAVIGREFGWGTVARLGPEPDQAQVGARLQALVRRGFLRPQPGAPTGGGTFEFAHALMRDVAYDGIPKSTRAEIHERIANLLADRRDADGAEEVLRGYHLEQAHCYLAEMGGSDERTRALAERGARDLAAAGTRAYDRGDLPAAIGLIDRALALMDAQDPAKLRLLATLGDALCERGELSRAESVLSAAIDQAELAGDVGARHHAEVLRAYARTFMEGRHGVDELQRVAEEALTVFEELDDDGGLARAWQSIAIAHVSHCQWSEVERARRKELGYARRSGNTGMVMRALSAYAYSLYFGPTPAPGAIAALEPIAREARGYPVAEATVLSILGALNAMEGRLERAAELHERGYALSEQLGALPAAEGALNWADTELLRGDPDSAERLLRDAYARLDRIGETAILASVAASLAEALHLQGRDDEAVAFTEVSEQAADADDVAAHTAWRATRSRILAARGEAAEAERLAREAVELALGTDDPNLSASALLALAATTGDTAEESSAATARALAFYERKGNELGRRRAGAAA